MPGQYLVDFHSHSTESDGALSPAELVQYAYAHGVRALAITDHETSAAYFQALPTAKKLGVALFCGIEFDCDGLDILGIDFDPRSPSMRKHLKEYWAGVYQRMNGRIAYFRKLGYAISKQLLLQHSRGKTISTRSYAQLFHAQGIPGFEDLPAARQRLRELFKTVPRRAEEKKSRDTLKTAKDRIQLILRSGGIPLLAHPARTFKNREELVRIVRALKKNGLKGFDVYHVDHSNNDVEFLLNLAQKENLIASGGMDFHKPGNPIGITNEVAIWKLQRIRPRTRSRRILPTRRKIIPKRKSK